MRLLALLLCLPAAAWSAPVARVVPQTGWRQAPVVTLTSTPLLNAPKLTTPAFKTGLPTLTVIPGVSINSAAKAVTAKTQEAKTAELSVIEAVAGVTQAVENGGMAETSTAGQVLQEAITGGKSIPASGAVFAQPSSNGPGPKLSGGGASRRRFSFKPSRKDDLPAPKFSKKRHIPFITLGLMLLNVLAYAGQNSLVDGGLAPTVEAAGALFAFRPDFLLDAVALGDWGMGLWSAATSVTAMFMHGNDQHLISNMIGLAIFGTALEIGVSRLRTLGVYFAAGALGFLALVTGLGGPIDGYWIGASGAVFAMMGGYVATLPARLRVPNKWNRIKLYLGAAAVVKFVGTMAIWLAQGPGVGGIAHSVHAFGFLFGLGLAALFLRYKPQN